MASGPRVLVVDGLSETEEVLKAVLEPRGLRVNRVRGHCADLSAPVDRPSVIVLHADSLPPAPAPGEPLSDVPRVIVGSVECVGDNDVGDGAHRLSHPFQYRELIATIERLIQNGRGADDPGE